MLEGNSEISVVIPLLNEQDNIGPLYEQITESLKGKYSYEILFIDDGSEDKSFEKLCELQRADNRIRVIRFRKNFGQTAAMAAGFDHASGDVVVPMDADLQNDPADIPLLLERLDDWLPHRFGR